MMNANTGLAQHYKLRWLTNYLQKSRWVDYDDVLNYMLCCDLMMVVFVCVNSVKPDGGNRDDGGRIHYWQSHIDESWDEEVSNLQLDRIL